MKTEEGMVLDTGLPHNLALTTARHVEANEVLRSVRLQAVSKQ